MNVAAPALPTGATSIPRNLVLPLLIAVAVIGVVGCGFVGLAPSRLVSGRPVMLWNAAGAGFVAGLTACAAILLAIGFAAPRRALASLAAAVAGTTVILVIAAAGDAAAILSVGAPPAARVSLGAGFWIALCCAGLALIDGLQRSEAAAVTRLIAAALAAGALIVLAEMGMFDALSLAREYMTRREVFAAAVLRHAVLVAASVGPALLIGVPLGLRGVAQEAV